MTCLHVLQVFVFEKVIDFTYVDPLIVFFIIFFISKFTHILGDVISEVHSVQTKNNK